MKITQEGNRMVLKDFNISIFLGALVIVLAGIYLLIVYGPNNVLLLVFCGLFIFLGAFKLATTKIITVSLDKAGKCTFSSFGLIGREFVECQSGQIKGIRLEKQMKISHHTSRRHHSTTSSYVYSIVFSLDTGKEPSFEFDTVTTAAINIQPSREQEIIKRAESVASFLGVPLKGTSTPAPGEMQKEAEDPYAGSL